MAAELTSPVPLSTPDNHIFTESEPIAVAAKSSQSLSENEFSIQYEIERTLREIRQHQWRKIALQFPDEMLADSARVYQLLARGIRQTDSESASHQMDGRSGHSLEEKVEHLNVRNQPQVTNTSPFKLTILADTSYGSCCVDEIAAEHVDAEVVIHYGRSCLSPTSRLPVLYVNTRRPLDHNDVLKAFKTTYSDTSAKIICVADIAYSHHVNDICTELEVQGYENVFATEVVRDNGSLIPNRTIPNISKSNGINEAASTDALKDWNIFHISNPPTALLLTLQSRVNAIHIFSTTHYGEANQAVTTQTNTAQILRRRYALVASLSTVSVWGILINTLSVKNYLHIVDHVKRQISAAGKKSYLFVVGKLNPAKVANFAEIGGWVVIGCWESSLIDSREFYRPIITPFELELALKTDEERVWTGEWRGDFQNVLDQAENRQSHRERTEGEDYRANTMPGAFQDDGDDEDNSDGGDFDDDDESAPPEYDLRTGRYVSRTRPMRTTPSESNISDTHNATTSMALSKRANGDLLNVNGVVSPAAEFLASSRSWRGLGSDFEVRYDEEDQGGIIGEGLTGIASGYTIGDSQRT